MLQMAKYIKHFLCFMYSLVQEKALSCNQSKDNSVFKSLMENQKPSEYGHFKERVRIQVLEIYPLHDLAPSQHAL